MARLLRGNVPSDGSVSTLCQRCSARSSRVRPRLHPSLLGRLSNTTVTGMRGSIGKKGWSRGRKRLMISTGCPASTRCRAVVSTVLAMPLIA